MPLAELQNACLFHICLQVVLRRGTDLPLRLLPSGTDRVFSGIQGLTVFEMKSSNFRLSATSVWGGTLEGKSRHSNAIKCDLMNCRKYLKKLEDEDKWRCLNCDASPLREQRAHFWAITRFHKVKSRFWELVSVLTSLVFSFKEKLSAKMGKAPSANPGSPATPKKNSKVGRC